MTFSLKKKLVMFKVGTYEMEISDIFVVMICHSFLHCQTFIRFRKEYLWLSSAICALLEDVIVGLLCFLVV